MTYVCLYFNGEGRDVTNPFFFSQYITVHRVQPSKQKGYILVAHTAFNKGDKGRGYGELRSFFSEFLVFYFRLHAS